MPCGAASAAPSEASAPSGCAAGFRGSKAAAAAGEGAPGSRPSLDNPSGDGSSSTTSRPGGRRGGNASRSSSSLPGAAPSPGVARRGSGSGTRSGDAREDMGVRPTAPSTASFCGSSWADVFMSFGMRADHWSKPCICWSKSDCKSQPGDMPLWAPSGDPPGKPSWCGKPPAALASASCWAASHCSRRSSHCMASALAACAIASASLRHSDQASGPIDSDSEMEMASILWVQVRVRAPPTQRWSQGPKRRPLETAPE
mmetsp:Transcript_12407/g.32911  ORF Transcript_12407/g.32911 Transcript_12407/m.32911 type:complete len:257 (-) Transcript_12407:29-799(-)